MVGGLPVPAGQRRAAWSSRDLPITPAQLARVIALVAEGALNDKLARQVVDGVLAGEGEPDEVVAAHGLAVVSDDAALTAAVDQALAAAPDVADKIRGGKVAAAGAIVGAVMKATGGQANAQTRARAGARARECVTVFQHCLPLTSFLSPARRRDRPGRVGRTLARRWRSVCHLSC